MPAAGTSATAAAFGAAAAAAAGGAGAASAGYSVASLPGARGGSSTGAPLESDNAKRKKKRGSLMKNDFYAFQKQDAKLGSEWREWEGGRAAGDTVAARWAMQAPHSTAAS